MITRFLFIAITAAIFAQNAGARIGETEKEIEARYGKHTGIGDQKELKDELGNPFRSYLFHGFEIYVTFENGNSVLEHFGKPYRGGRVTYAESLAILNVYGDIWELDKKNNYDSPEWHWHDKDHNLQAFLDGSGLGIVTTMYYAKEITKTSELEKKRLQGF